MRDPTAGAVLIRFAAIASTIVILVFGMGALLVLLSVSTPKPFGDLQIYQDATGRLFADQGWYRPEQLNGPYDFLETEAVLYPPVAAWLFLPWLWLPAWTFSLIPILVVAWFTLAMRPRAWAWPLLAACIAWPMTPILAYYANPTLWIAMFVALGLRFGWPGALVLLKPSLAPFAMVGIRSRGWWLAAATLAIGSLPFVEPTLEYPRVVLDAQGAGLLYSWWHIPLVLIPVLGWAGRSDGAGHAQAISATPSS